MAVPIKCPNCDSLDFTFLQADFETDVNIIEDYRCDECETRFYVVFEPTRIGIDNE